MSDPIDDLLDQAASYAKKLLEQVDDESEDDDVSFNFTHPNITSTADILNGKHDLVKMRECSDKSSDGVQRGMYAKRDIKAGANLVISKPIVVCWDVEDDESDDEEDESDDEDNEEQELVEGKKKAHLGSDDDSDDSDGDGDEIDQKVAASGLKTAASDNDADDNSSDSDDESIQEATGAKRNGILILRAIEKIKQTPSLWTDTLSTLFPRDIETALNLPPWFCSDPSIGMEIEMQMSKTLPSLSLFSKDGNEEVCKEISMRLPLIVRYNVLSVETCSELFVYPDVSKGGMASLGGTGLYGPEVSYFNHSCVPNVSRYCIGDVLFFVTNRDIVKGEELCFSYIEHEFLCENSAKRSALLDMDFELDDDDDGGRSGNERPNKKQKVAKMPSKEEEQVHYPLIDAEMQSELMATPQIERMDLINELLDQKVDRIQDYQCDKYQLHILKAITLDGLGQTSKALLEWEMAVDFAVKNFPLLDETTIALQVQAALCALKCFEMGNDRMRAKRHADKALKMHKSLFGGGKERFLKRYEKEFMCPLRPVPEATMLMNVQELFGQSTAVGPKS
eukprot:CAMPEP_0172304888 /NCGR_PEP_ID=MMETSP1058-20130122/6257_1 /TAXON_ID=83371 /ORGANISM="Detonula confervacea, Strain CCMP 353" /LENGTH=564 /DNA_ID=CAMNT_0013016295 /DNA_START=81 /DNA_END=1775 /DNA_ORIENTATION=+